MRSIDRFFLRKHIYLVIEVGTLSGEKVEGTQKMGTKRSPLHTDAFVVAL